MDIFKENLPVPPAESALRARGYGLFVPKTTDWIPCGYHQDTVLDMVKERKFSGNSESYRSMDMVDIVISSSYAREFFTYVYMTYGNKHNAKISRARLNRNNYIHYIQKRKKYKEIK